MLWIVRYKIVKPHNWIHLLLLFFLKNYIKMLWSLYEDYFCILYFPMVFVSKKGNRSTRKKSVISFCTISRILKWEAVYYTMSIQQQDPIGIAIQFVAPCKNYWCPRNLDLLKLDIVLRFIVFFLDLDSRDAKYLLIWL